MPYHMMVVLSEPEKKRVFSDMLYSLNKDESQTLILFLAKELRHGIGDEERTQLLKKIENALTPRPPKPQKYVMYVAKPKNRSSRSRLNKLTAALEVE